MDKDRADRATEFCRNNRGSIAGLAATFAAEEVALAIAAAVKDVCAYCSADMQRMEFQGNEWHYFLDQNCTERVLISRCVAGPIHELGRR